MRFHHLLLLFLLLLWTAGSCQEHELSFLVVRSRDGAVLYSQEAEKLRVPASTLKLLTAAAALEHLPHDLTFSTKILADSDLRGGRLANLYLVGEADPELSTHHLKDFARELRDLGLRRVLKDIVVNPGPHAFPPYGSGWAWDDAGHSYSPEIGGLVLDGGEYPLSPLWSQVLPHAKPAGMWSIPGRGGLLVQGHAPLTAAPPCPSLRTGERLRAELKELGVEVKGGVRLGSGGSFPLVEHTSRPLKSILKKALAESDNLAMELIYRVNTQRLPSSLQGAPLRAVDGSGLSRYNLLSAQQLVTLLLENRALLEVLPSAGEGTLRMRFLQGTVAGQIRAKTGTLSSVSSLAGYLFPDTDHECAFAILINGHLGPASERKLLEERLVERWVEEIVRANIGD